MNTTTAAHTPTIEITSPDENGHQYFKVDGVTRYGVWKIDSIRGIRYSVSPAAHIGRHYMVADAGEAFALAMEEIERFM